MRLLLFVWILFSSLAGLAHPLHLSVSNIDLRNDSVFLSVRVFSDDFYANLLTKKKHAVEFNNYSTQDSLTRQAIAYIKNQFNIIHQNSPVDLQFCSKKEDELSVWYHFSGVFPYQKGKITIENRILTVYFSDQKNLVIIQIGEEQKGLEFNNTTLHLELEIN